MALPLILVALLLAGCGGPALPPVPTASPSPADQPSPTAAVATVALPPPVSPMVVGTLSAAPASPAASQPTSTATATLVPTATILPTPAPERLVVVGSGSPAVNMRSEPGTGSSVVKSVRDGTEVIVIGTDRESDGRIWRNVQDGDAAGWIVGTALRPLPTPTVTPSVTPTQAATPTTASTATSAPTVVPSVTATSAQLPPTRPAPAAGGERVEVFGTGGQGANLRAEPGTGGGLIRTVPEGSELTVIGPDREAGGLTWRNVRDEDGETGWIVEEAVRSLAPPPPSVRPAPSTPSPTATATPAPTAAPTASPSPGEPPATPGRPAGEPPGEAPSAEPTPEPQIVEVYGTTTGANLRVQPSRTATVIKSVADGARLTVIGEDETGDGITWRHVQTDDGLAGWLALEVVRPLIIPTATPRPGAPGIGAPIVQTPVPEAQLSEAELAARPCRPGQVKGDASTGVFYAADHPDYPGLLQRVRCFDDAGRARASGFRAADAPAPSPEPAP